MLSSLRNTGHKGMGRGLLLPLILISAAFLLSGVLILFLKGNPLQAYVALFKGAFGSPSALINTVNKAVPICFAAFAVAVSQFGGTFNIGVEGQLLFGALGATVTGVYLRGLPMVVHVPICLLAGMAFGMVWSLVPAALFIKRGVNLLVVFLMTNTIASFLLQYLVLEVIGDPNALRPASYAIQKSAELPYLLVRPNRLTIGILLLLLTAALLAFFMKKTTLGYEMHAVGANRSAAEYAGIKSGRYMFWSLLIGGALAGLCGSIEIMGNHHRLYTDFSPGYGFDGIPIALLAKGDPWAMLLGGLLFGALRTGSINMQAQTGVPDEIVSVIQGSLIVFIAGEYFVRYLLQRGRKREVEKV